MQNLIQKFRQSSIVFEKPGFLSEKLKILTSSNYHRVQYCLQKCYFLKFCLDLELFGKIKKTCFLLTRFYIFINNSRSKQIKKNSEHAFVDIIK